MRRQLQGFWFWAAKGVAVAFVIFQLYTAAIGLLPDMRQRALHVLFGLTLTFILIGPRKGRPETKIPIWDIILICFIIVGCLNAYISYFRFAYHPLESNTLDIISAIALIILTIEAGRRVL